MGEKAGDSSLNIGIPPEPGMLYVTRPFNFTLTCNSWVPERA